MVDNSKGQRYKTCDIIGCEEQGRVLAKLGHIDIAYCPKHRKKYGERIIDALINSKFNYKLTNFLSEIKGDVFFSDDMFCEECSLKLKNYFISKTAEMEKLLEYAEENDITSTKDVKNDLAK